ncbi:MAG: hypothetical protein R8N50_03340 [Alphaproteobacteria bacterium]|nr:hypothetical protein [Alphaproteobacteria bacterium]
MKQIFVLIASLFIFHSAHCGIWEDCMDAISDNENFQQEINDIFDTGVISVEIVKANKSKIFAAIGEVLIDTPECSNKISSIAQEDYGKVWIGYDDKTYAFRFKMSDLFEYVVIPTGIMVYNDRSLGAGDKIELSEIQKLYWSDACSDHVIWDNLDNDAAVNVAGQKVFSQYGGEKNEFFLDFEEGNDRRAFPGLVLMDKTHSSSEAIVAFGNLQKAIKAAKDFADALTDTACSNDGLAVYVVALSETPSPTNDKTGWGIVAGVAGGSAAVVGTSSALAAAGATGLWGAAAVSGTVLVVGWVIAGLLGGAATVISLVPPDIIDLKGVTVLGGPYIIK